MSWAGGRTADVSKEIVSAPQSWEHSYSDLCSPAMLDVQIRGALVPSDPRELGWTGLGWAGLGQNSANQLAARQDQATVILSNSEIILRNS